MIVRYTVTQGGDSDVTQELIGNIPEDIDTAPYYEAGHAIVALLPFDLPVTITIEIGDDLS